MLLHQLLRSDLLRPDVLCSGRLQHLRCSVPYLLPAADLLRSVRPRPRPQPLLCPQLLCPQLLCAGLCPVWTIV